MTEEKINKKRPAVNLAEIINSKDSYTYINGKTVSKWRIEKIWKAAGHKVPERKHTPATPEEEANIQKAAEKIGIKIEYIEPEMLTPDQLREKGYNPDDYPPNEDGLYEFYVS